MSAGRGGRLGRVGLSGAHSYDLCIRDIDAASEWFAQGLDHWTVSPCCC